MTSRTLGPVYRSDRAASCCKRKAHCFGQRLRISHGLLCSLDSAVRQPQGRSLCNSGIPFSLHGDNNVHNVVTWSRTQTRLAPPPWFAEKVKGAKLRETRRASRCFRWAARKDPVCGTPKKDEEARKRAALHHGRVSHFECLDIHLPRLECEELFLGRTDRCQRSAG